MKGNSMIIHISWSGPYNLNDIKKLNEDIDFGIYQIYGSHPLYGNDVLIYIGKAQAQTFYTRIKQEGWENTNDPNTIKVYIGRLIGKKSVSESEWDTQINLAEKLLIFSHAPALNSSNLNSLPEKELVEITVFNWGSHRQLYPEVSGKRWSSKYDDIENDAYYS
jgi:hypothetical protein